MIDKFNVKLNSPSCRINDNSLLANEELNSLLDSITDFFSQQNVIYTAELTVSNNEWDTVYNEFGERIGQKRKDISFDLSELTHIILDAGNIIFKVGFMEKIFKIPVTDKFFYFFEWEPGYYD